MQTIKLKKTYLAAGAVALLLILMLIALKGGTAVETVKSAPGSITRTVEDIGYVQAVASYDLQAMQAARIAQIPVEIGQEVEKGQILLILENPDLLLQLADLSSQLSQAQARAEAARAALERTQLQLADNLTNYNRMKELYEVGAVSKAEYEKALLLYESSEKSVKEQKAFEESSWTQVKGLSQMLEQLRIKEQQLVVTSPANGTVLNLPVKQEQMTTPGSLLVSIGSTGQLEIKADLLSDDLTEVKVGQKVEISAPVLGEKVLSGEVKKIYPRAEEKQSALGVIQRRVPVIISLSETANLQPGFEVRVKIATLHKENVLVLPREAVRTTKNGQKEVLAVINNRVKHQPVEIGMSDRNYIEITGGLNEGTLVIKDASLDLKENTRVKSIESTFR